MNQACRPASRRHRALIFVRCNAPSHPTYRSPSRNVNAQPGCLRAHDAGEVARSLGMGDALDALEPVDERNHLGSTASSEPGVDASASPFGFQRTIERIRLTNCGGIKALDVRTDPASGASRRPEAAATPAIVVIGENGCGKSTLLRALAIALAQPRGFYQHARKLVGPFAQTATIEVWLSGELMPRRVTISAAGHVRATGGQALPLVAA